MCDVGLVKVDNDDYALYQSRFVLLRLKVSPKSLQASTKTRSSVLLDVRYNSCVIS